MLSENENIYIYIYIYIYIRNEEKKYVKQSTH